MKKTMLVIALAVVLTFALTATAFATSAKTWNYQTDYYTWGSWSGNGMASSTGNVILSSVGSNPTNPGVHANYLANTAKCGICHSVHRANGSGVKLLNASVATCAGCHAAGTGTVTTKLVSWQSGGPHSSGTATGCLDRACHTSSPHGVGVSTYKLLASKLIDSDSDTWTADAITNGSLNAGDLNMTAVTYTSAQQHSVIAGYTCNRDGCHNQTNLAIIVKNSSEQRWVSYPELGGEVAKTGHMSVATADADHYSYTDATGCTGCHDQTDTGTTSGFTFPHSQTPQGTSNLGAGRAYLWMGYAAAKGDAETAMGSGDKAFDGACLKCHRDTGGAAGIGVTF